MSDRELDALVSENVIGNSLFTEGDDWEYGNFDGFTNQKRCVHCGFTNHNGNTYFHECAVPHYSTDIHTAWSVVEKLNSMFTNVAVCHDNGWGVRLWNIGSDGAESGSVQASADTAPRAICLAALKALGIEAPP